MFMTCKSILHIAKICKRNAIFFTRPVRSVKRKPLFLTCFLNVKKERVFFNRYHPSNAEAL